MSGLTYKEKAKFERVLDMGGGYVLDFKDGSFGMFFSDYDIDIHADKYRVGGTSKANKLRAFWDIENDHLVGRVLNGMLDQCLGDRLTAAGSDRMAIAQCREITGRLLGAAPSLATLKEAAVTFNARHLAEQLQRIESSIQSDPALAIGTAKELIETCCKTILAERGKAVQGSPDIPALTKEVLKELKLVPEGVSDQARGSEVIKRMLRSLGSIGNDLAELRGLYGTGHGKHGQATGLTPRHARLAVATAAAFSTFMFETHKEKPQ